MYSVRFYAIKTKCRVIFGYYSHHVAVFHRAPVTLQLFAYGVEAPRLMMHHDTNSPYLGTLPSWEISLGLKLQYNRMNVN